ncbi:type II toxin-antitoxin system RelB/DinJ family antitoxin [Caminibacter sp.]
MKVQTTIRVDKDKLKESKEILKELGLNFSEAVNLFVNMVVNTKGIPFELKLNDEIKNRIDDIEKGKNIEEIDLEDLKCIN